jgi:Sulfotransferase family
MALPESSGRSLHGILRRGGRAVERSVRRLVRLDESSLLAAARRRAGADDFGDSDFREPLHRLVHSLEDESRLTLFGRIGARADIVQMLVNRLALERDRARHPEIASVEIRAPLLITGLPRTGSTFLHGLLAQDPSNRVPIHWETREPSPPPGPERREKDARIARAERQLRWFYRLAPEFKRIHPVEARMPEECVVILSHSFLSYQFSSTFHVPSYQEWLVRQDLRPAYRYHRRFLQQLGWRCPADRWVLKAPPHLPGLDALFAVYPDARVVMTHRDPLEVLGSITSLHAVLRRTFSDAVDPKLVGPEVSEMLLGDIERGMEARRRGCAPATQFFDVRYEEVLGDPLGVARRIYDYFGLPLAREAEEAMTHYLARSPKDRFGTHLYSLEEFGLDPSAERERYRGYREAYGV